MFSPAKAITAGALVFALGGVMLIAQPFDQGGGGVAGAAVDDEALRRALVTGTIAYDYDSGEGGCLSGSHTSCVERPSADGVTRFGIVGMTASVEMSDPRLSGDATVDDNTEVSGFAILPDVPGLDTAEVEEEGVWMAWGTMRIVNENGTWEGTWIDSSTIALDRGKTTLLAGTGAYDGLSAILYEGSDYIGDVDDEEVPLDGVIFPGDLPPDR